MPRFIVGVAVVTVVLICAGWVIQKCDEANEPYLQ